MRILYILYPFYALALTIVEPFFPADHKARSQPSLRMRGLLLFLGWIFSKAVLVAGFRPIFFPTRSATKPYLAKPLNPYVNSRNLVMTKEGSFSFQSSSGRDEFIKAIAALAIGAQLLPRIAGADYDEEDEKPKPLTQYIQEIDRMNLRIPDFQKGLEWVNSPPLSFQKELKGKIVLLDFFTYCCINCQHILPGLAKLEKKYKDTPFVVVGVHSPKFENEKSSTNVKQAVDRYGIRHPVVNDKGMTMWNSVGVSSWPTLALLGPKGNLLSIWAGEGYEQRIDDFIQASLQYYGDSLDASPLPAPGTVPREVNNSPLNYPGKLFYDVPQQRLFVSDSSNHRILMLGKNGQFMSSVGSKSGTPGFEDGDFSTARFNNPQGLALVGGNLLYVADTENHAVRLIDLKAQTVTTIAGNGEQGFDYTGGKKGKSQYLSSPWDVVPFPEDPKRKLLVAMAGTHQIWDVDCESGTASCYSGTGREREYNTEDRINSAWAQPSGLSLSADGRSALYVADSESSSIRELMFKGPGPTRTVVGGSGTADGSNLFAFGDRDGKGSAAKLQHPLGVAVLDEQSILVADTYNHKIKLVNPVASTVKTIAGSGKPGLKDGKGTNSEFWEPGGLAIDQANDIVFVADTNNKALRTLNYKTGEVKTLDVSTIPSVAVAGEGIVTEQKPLVNRKRVRVLDSAPVGLSSEVVVRIALPIGCKFTPGVESKWQLVDPSGVLDASSPRTGLLKLDGTPTSIKIKAKQEGKIELETAVYYCQIEDGVCKVDGVVLQVPVENGGGSSVTFQQDVVLKTKAKLAAPK